MKSMRDAIMAGLVLAAALLSNMSAHADSGSTSSTRTSGGRCQIILNQACKASRALPVNTYFDDNYQDASGNATVCVKRAQEYYDWCGSPNPYYVAYSVYSVNGKVVVSAAGAKTTNYIYSPTSSGASNYGILALSK
jgi:hypothetical protein